MVEFQILGQHLHLETPIITSEPMIKTIVVISFHMLILKGDLNTFVLISKSLYSVHSGSFKMI